MWQLGFSLLQRSISSSFYDQLSCQYFYAHLSGPRCRAESRKVGQNFQFCVLAKFGVFLWVKLIKTTTSTGTFALSANGLVKLTADVQKALLKMTPQTTFDRFKEKKGVESQRINVRTKMDKETQSFVLSSSKFKLSVKSLSSLASQQLTRKAKIIENLFFFFFSFWNV